MGLALGTNLEFYASQSKGLKLKVRNFWGLILTFVEVTVEKLVWGSLCALMPPPPILNRVKKHFTALYEDENKLYFNEDSDDAVFNHIEIGIANIDINDVNLDDNFD